MIVELNRLPEWLSFKEASAKCRGNSMNVDEQEKILLNCFVSVRNRTKNFKYSTLPNYNKIELCAISLCQRNFKHLSSLCNRL